ncbi:FMN-binding negative transcriptional regulator [Pyxidicoccus fallax]|uniref:FMN-binding negative transcriptional regulator n=1 Tax=Pyxidicoccus fallax TaxID=394095 RepID=A0A848LLA4_9BACT|nr:FMN-binding negative transcriptional regulator [Pyxidicoccus fallax]NMO18460.1 FMN-binding negative transcriptional regulator [Pyxidicoccus fallax]NPC84044.1 FMN-binding negative transcriptional regulator [Pyxidicoccus fallax]
MHIPGHFREKDEARLFALMEQYNFATLVTLQENGVPVASHLPFLVVRALDGSPRLLSHMSRANPQWQTFSRAGEALLIFQGPHAYVSSAWYSVPNVPTWNYAVVHAYGTPRVLEEPGEVLRSLRRLSVKHEEGNSPRWNPDEAGDVIQRLLPGIVAFEFQVSRLEGSFKLSQNRSEQDQQTIMERLDRSTHPGGPELVRFMKSLKPRE